MNRDQVSVGMTVLFGRRQGEKTLGLVVACNPSRAKVKTLEGRGRNDIVGQVWAVPYSLLYPAGDRQAPPPVQHDPELVKALEALIAAYGQGITKAALNAISGREAA